MSDPLVLDCVLSATGTDAVGVEVSGNATIAYTLITAATAGLRIDAGATAEVYGNQYAVATINGILDSLRGDRAAWDTTTAPHVHARDIDEVTYLYHNNPSAPPLINALTDGHIFVGNVANQAIDVAMSGDATLADTGALTLKNTGPGATGPIGDSTHVSQVTIDAQGRVTALASVAISAGHTIEDEGTALPTEPNLNFTGNLVTATDNAGASRTDVTISATIPINIYNETQNADGVSLTYYLTNYAAPGTIRVYIDGVRQFASDDTAATDIVTFTVAPDAGALLLFDYEMDQA